MIERQVPVEAPPARVAAALADSPLRAGMRIEPAGAGARVVFAARVAPEALARAIEDLALAELHAIRSSTAGQADGHGSPDTNHRGATP